MDTPPLCDPRKPVYLGQEERSALKEVAVDWCLSHGFVLRSNTARGSCTLQAPASSPGGGTQGPISSDGPAGGSPKAGNGGAEDANRRARLSPATTTPGIKAPLVDMSSAVHAPFSLLPTPFPRRMYEFAVSLQPHFNTLVHNICLDPDFVREVSLAVGPDDAFTAKLLSIYEEVLTARGTTLASPTTTAAAAAPATASTAAAAAQPQSGRPNHPPKSTPMNASSKEGNAAAAAATAAILPSHGDIRRGEITMAVLRSDYMIHGFDVAARLLQVELNTIAASFASMSSRASALHKYLAALSPGYALAAGSPKPASMPPNEPHVAIAEGIALAHRLYAHVGTVVLFVVQPNERNAMDQRILEHTLFENHGVRVIRATFKYLAEHSKLGENGEFFVRDPFSISPDKNNGAAGAALGSRRCAWTHVSVVYFRAGYGPGDYDDEPRAWGVRRAVEMSRAVKCPSIAQQLAGTKKMQQVLASAIVGGTNDEPVLTRYLHADAARSAVARCFAGLYPLDDRTEAGREAIARGLAPELARELVLKPQREGGGNNYYGDDIPRVLARLSARERNSYILMERIRPAPTRNILVRNGEMCECDVLSELGVYGIYVADGNKIVHSMTGGHLLRTKPVSSDEGGVAAGFAVLDSPVLY